jgi:hypothetical protein
LTNVIQFPTKEEVQDEEYLPADEFVTTDSYGGKMYCFTCSAVLKDGLNERPFLFNFWAYDFADAERKMEAIRSTGRVDGQLIERIEFDKE